MRCCQVCGCTSWGPVGNPDELRRASAFLPDARVEEFVRCDGCKTVAKREFLDLHRGPFVNDVATGSAPAMFPDLPAMMKEFIAPIPPPPSRTERLVVKLLDSFLIDSDTSPKEIVKLARDIETALDVLERKDLQQPWLVSRSFATQAEFEQWCTEFFDTAMGSLSPGTRYSQDLYDRAAAHVRK